MSGARHRRKGNCAERAIVAHQRNRVAAAERIPVSSSAGSSFIGDITVPLLGADPLTGVEVHLPRHCKCGHDILHIGPGRDAHRASLHCTRCARHCGWLSHQAAKFLSDVIEHFGRPIEPICVRGPPGETAEFVHTEQ
jgi:hypothetical protein